MFAGQLDEKHKRALMAFATLPASHMTVPVTEFEAGEPREYMTTPLVLFAKDIYKPTSGSWVVTYAYGSLMGAGSKLSVVSDISSGSQATQRFRTLQTALDPNAAREDAAALMVLFGAISFLTSEPLASLSWVRRTAHGEAGETPMLLPVFTQGAARGPSAQQLERKSIPPTTAHRGSPGRGAMRPFADWIRKHKYDYAGKWVALDEGGQLIDSDASRFALQRRLQEVGRLRGAVITLVPDESR